MVTLLNRVPLVRLLRFMWLNRLLRLTRLVTLGCW